MNTNGPNFWTDWTKVYLYTARNDLYSCTRDGVHFDLHLCVSFAVWTRGAAQERQKRNVINKSNKYAQIM